VRRFLETRKHATFSRSTIDFVTARSTTANNPCCYSIAGAFDFVAAAPAASVRQLSVTLTYLRRDRRMCHYCNYSERIPERCPKCDSECIQFMSLGRPWRPS
jgi:hypothetical protein